jgi:hypothetical protein
MVEVDREYLKRCVHRAHLDKIIVFIFSAPHSLRSFSDNVEVSTSSSEKFSGFQTMEVDREGEGNDAVAGRRTGPVAVEAAGSERLIFA